MANEEKILVTLFETWAQREAESIVLLPGSGSYRKYYRITCEGKSVLGVYNDDRKENIAFLSFTESFLNEGFPVPAVFFADLEKSSYLLEDLGDKTLFQQLEESRMDGGAFTEQTVRIYEEVLKWLPQFQVKGAGTVNYRVCYPRASFDRQSMMWDLNYFKYYFLKLAKVPYDEQQLEDDFNTLADFLLEADGNYFMYRDFQSRNIMVADGLPWFIDYQGGRKGPLHYDIASLLYDAKAKIPQESRDRFLLIYLDELEKLIPVDRQAFMRHYFGFVLIRILQALGAYGFRGYYENKSHFLQSIPYALENLKGIIDSGGIPVELPMLMKVFQTMIRDPRFTHSNISESQLTVTVTSFSFKHPLPSDPNGNGGGFVFDCRALPNPGKFEEYRSFTGKDQTVIDFLKRESAVDEFLNHVFSLVDQSVKRYAERDFSHLMINFGCTGGQHRSVYCAEQLATHLKQKFPIKVVVQHTRFP
jgi:aminoglycoside/choline kinase family phosphotransferase